MPVEFVTPPIDRDYGSFHNWVNQAVARNWKYYDEIGRLQAMELHNQGEGGFMIALSKVKARQLSPIALEFVVHSVQTGNAADAQTTYGITNLVAQGIKVYKPLVQECEALENCSPNLPAEDYRQPFSTLVVEYPRAYTEERIVAGTLIEGTPIKASPLATIVHHVEKENAILFLTLTQAGLALTLLVWIRSGCTLAECLENDWAMQFRGVGYGGVSYTEEECVLSKQAVLVAANACLLLCKVGMRKIGPQNASHYERVLGRLQKNKEHREANRQELNRIPVYYGFDQTVKIYEEERQVPHDPGEGGWTVKPHWRRGHWRRLPGYEQLEAQGQQAERVFIKPVLVNAHLLQAPLSSTKVTLEKR